MPASPPPRLTGPSDDPERARRFNDRVTDDTLQSAALTRIYERTIESGTDLTIRHDLRLTLIPLVSVVGVGNTVEIVEVGTGYATLRLTAGTTADVLVRFEDYT